MPDKGLQDRDFSNDEIALREVRPTRAGYSRDGALPRPYYTRPAREAERPRAEHAREAVPPWAGQSRSPYYTRPAREAEPKKMDPHAPIGVFDSGAGGLTILSALRQELPHEHYIYIGDTAHCPYGVRTEADITALTVNACRFLIEQGVKLIVVGCNTASQAALNTLRATFSIPFVGVVPAVKPAARMTRKGRIGIAATNQAARATYLRQLIDNFAEGIQVHAVGCPELVTLVERGELAGSAVEQTLQQALAPLLEHDIDVLVLGCTHFPALRTAIGHVVGEQVQIIDSGAAIARRTHAILEAEGARHPSNGTSHLGDLQLWCSGDAQSFTAVASAILGYPVIASHAQLEEL